MIAVNVMIQYWSHMPASYYTINYSFSSISRFPVWPVFTVVMVAGSRWWSNKLRIGLIIPVAVLRWG